jgi:hypothetical protein
MKTYLLKTIGVFFTVVTLFFGVTTVSNAALPAGVTTGFTTLNTDAMALIDLAWDVAIPIAVAFIILKLFKKAASSAT